MSLTTLLSGATLAAVLWLFRTAQQLREDHAILRTILTGEKGDNGVNGEVKALRTWRHDEIVPFQSKTNMRLALLEDRRTGEDDRRHPA